MPAAEPAIWVFIIVGFLAQLVDGALGMAYGVSSTAVLLNLGLAPATASASVHAAEICTTAVSGLSHLRLGNVVPAVFRRLVIPGVAGGVIGAYLLASLPGDTLRPFVAVYLLLMGLAILVRSFRPAREVQPGRELLPLGLAGGFFDAIGGGGWGPIVTSTLVARGGAPRFVVGSVNLAEFFVTLCQSIVFILTIGWTHWRIILGLIIGGVAAAPLSAYACRRLPTIALMRLVGALIVVLNLRTLWQSLA